eukprot:TRINITY_DN60467_c2_g1_i1.p1 TRINITY_DN60467_c2_g1~~TRINITY_DN60467_c2_g1_i1.p1  ORF type:complete len:169 (-),score=19.33 TRINITY_DN60467_c2_g1_i1:367-813(-)
MKKLLLGSLLLTASVFASSIEVEDAYVRATPPGLPNSAAFLTIENETDTSLSLVKASSQVAKSVELHTHDMKDGVMKMYQVPKIDIAADSKTVLKPGGFHIMLIGLSKPLKEGEKVSLTLEFSNGETKTIEVPIKKVMSGMKHHNMKH